MEIRESAKDMGLGLLSTAVGGSCKSAAKIMIKTGNPVCVILGIGVGGFGLIMQVEGIARFVNGTWNTLVEDSLDSDEC